MFWAMDDNTLEWLDILGKALMVAAVGVLVLSLIGAVAIGSSSSDIELIGQFQQQNKGTLAVMVLGFGFTSAGVLAGLGAIVRLLVGRERSGE